MKNEHIEFDELYRLAEIEAFIQRHDMSIREAAQ